MQPQKIDLLLHCRWLLPIIPEDQIMENVSVAIDAGRIISLVATSEVRENFSASEEITLDRHIVMPGLINAHCQSSMRLLRSHSDYSRADKTLEHPTQLNNPSIIDAQFVQDSNMLAMAEMIKTGTTCFADMCFPQQALVDSVRQIGLRCQISFMVCDHSTAYAQNAEEHIHKGLALYDKIGEHPLLKVACAPQNLNRMSNPVLRQLSAYANELDLSLHIPCHSTSCEIDYSQSEYTLRPLSRLDNMGLLSPQTQLIDMNHISTEDMQLLEQSNAHIVNCPSTRLMLSEQSCSTNKLQQAPINTALGTGNITNESSLDLLSEVKICALMTLSDNDNHRLSTAHRALRSATINGARALGWDYDIGSLEAGKFADIIAIEVDPIAQQPLYNPHLQIVTASTGTQVSHSWVAGQPMMLNKKLVSLNEKAVIQSANNWQEKLAS